MLCPFTHSFWNAILTIVSCACRNLGLARPGPSLRYAESRRGPLLGKEMSSVHAVHVDLWGRADSAAEAAIHSPLQPEGEKL